MLQHAPYLGEILSLLKSIYKIWKQKHMQGYADDKEYTNPSVTGLNQMETQESNVQTSNIFSKDD